MIDGFRCEDKETLVSYVYGEIDTDRRRQVEAHLLTCAPCQGEVGGFAGVRDELASWAAPETEMELTLVRKGAHAPKTRWGGGTLPAWAGVAAAVLVLATGAAIANVQIRFVNGQMILSAGPGRAPAPAEPGASSPRSAQVASVVSDAEWREALTRVETGLRGEIDAVRSSSPPAQADATVSGSDAALLRRIQSLISESEQRQREELALRLTQFNRDLEVQRRTDLVRIEQGFGQVEGRAEAEAARQRQWLNYLVRVSGQSPQ